MYFLQTLRLLHGTIGLLISIGKNRMSFDHVVAACLLFIRMPRDARRGLGAPCSLAFLGVRLLGAFSCF